MSNFIIKSSPPSPRACRDNAPNFVGLPTTGIHPPLPACARLSLNHCQLPAIILGSLSFQRHPVPLAIDGVAELHRDFFLRLDACAEPLERARQFQCHMLAAFNLEHAEEMGHQPATGRGRDKANYLRLIRGWSFNADGIEGAVLKGWVESRFGLLPRYHGAPIRGGADEAYGRYLQMRAAGLYGANALEFQLDLLYAYCQYELARQWPQRRHFTLYRGVNRVAEHETLSKLDHRRKVVLLNNLSSFSQDRERAGEFGDFIMEAQVPLAKIFAYPALVPGLLRGEGEMLVIGGLYEVSDATV